MHNIIPVVGMIKYILHLGLCIYTWVTQLLVSLITIKVSNCNSNIETNNQQRNAISKQASFLNKVWACLMKNLKYQELFLLFSIIVTMGSK